MRRDVALLNMVCPPICPLASTGLGWGVPIRPEISLPLTMQYMLFVSASSLVAIGISAVVFLSEVHPIASVRDFLRTDWKYIGVAWIVTTGVNELAFRFHADRTYTNLIYEIEGSTVAVFQAVTSPLLTVFFTGVYLVGFPTLVLFTYVRLKACNESAARRYALAYVVLVLLALPFFIWFPVGVPARYPDVDIQPLMYHLDPVIKAGVLATDTLLKAFPSLHAGLSVLAALYSRNADRRYMYAATMSAIVIVFSTFYLGIHWLLDAVFAVILAGIAYWSSQRVGPKKLHPRYWF